MGVAEERLLGRAAAMAGPSPSPHCPVGRVVAILDPA
jgi:hypothetical protein